MVRYNWSILHHEILRLTAKSSRDWLLAKAVWLPLIGIWSGLSTGCGSADSLTAGIHHPLADSLPSAAQHLRVNATLAEPISQRLTRTLQELRRLTPAWDISTGELNRGTVSQTRDAILLDDTTFAVLEDRQSRIILLSTVSNHVSYLGGPGYSPNQMQRPRALISRGESLVVLDHSSKLQFFGKEGSTYVHRSQYYPRMQPSDICFIDRGIVALGSKAGSAAILHLLDVNGSPSTSFGSGYRAADDFVRFTMNSGRLECFPERGLVIVAFSRFPEVHAYFPNGDPAWIARLDPYQSLALIERDDGSVINGLVPGHYEAGCYLYSSTYFDDVLILQYALRTMKSYDNRLPYQTLYTFLLDITNGEVAYVGADMPAFLSIAAGAVLSYDELPYPTLRVLRRPQ